MGYMTEKEFLERLEQTPRHWEVLKDGQIRLIDSSRSGSACPISALTNHEAWNYCTSVKQLRLEDSLVVQILYAADHRPTFWQLGPKRLRAKLLKATGLALT